ncbi:ATP-binding protein [Microbacterium sp. NPDC091313]
MQVRFFGGLAVAGDDGPIAVSGRNQQAVLFRLAIDAGTTVGYRALAEDVWGLDLPDDPRAALQSLVSRLRRTLPEGSVQAVPGGYRLAVTRAEVDVARFADLVKAAATAPDAAAAAALARDALALWIGDPWTPSDDFDWAVRDLLEDRARAEALVRAAPAAPAAAPAPAAAAAAVPAALTPLVGRGPELALLDAQLDAARLVTLVGPGGAGKTTLATESARRRAGSIVVELAPAAAGEVWEAIAGAVGRGIRLDAGQTAPVSARDRVIEALPGRRGLLVLDNCEHVSAEAAAIAADLLRTLPDLRVLATSREPLGVPGEAFVDLGPLPLHDAVELFAQRMRAASGHVPADDDAPTVERIVSRLDGLPLAVELAAAKTRTLSVAEIDRGLDDRFALLSSGPRAAERRHQTLRALIDWSWDTLGDDERTGLLAAAIFPDGIDASDAAAVGGAVGVPSDVFDRLVDRSLLARRDGRFRMLETVREYGISRLRDDGRETAVRTAAAQALGRLAAGRDATLRGPGMRASLAWFDANDENLGASLRHAHAAGDEQTAIALVRAQLWSWVLRERFEPLQAALTPFLHSERDDSEAAVVVRGAAVLLASVQFAPRPTESESDPLAFAAAAERIAASAHRYDTDLAAVLAPLLAATAEGLRSGEPWMRELVVADPAPTSPEWALAAIVTLRAGAAQNSGDLDTLGRTSDQALALFRRLGDPWGIAFASQLRAESLILDGRLDDALALAEESSVVAEGLTSTADAVQQRSLAVGILARLGRWDRARERLAEIERFATTDGSARALVSARMTAAGLHVAAGDGAAALAALQTGPDETWEGYPEQIRAWWESKRAQALLLLDRADEARAALRVAVPPARHSRDQPIASEVALAIAGWLAITARPQEAAEALAVAATLRGGVDHTDPFRLWVAARTDAAPAENPADAASAFAALAAVLD